MSTIVIGVDDSTHSEDAVAFAGELARRATGDVLLAGIHTAGDDARERAAGETVRRMSELLSDLPRERVRTVTVAHTSVAHALHTLAEAEQAAMVVVGSTHTGTLGRVRPGATGERLLNGAPCAIAVVPDGYHRGERNAAGAIGVAYDGSKEASTAAHAAAGIAHALGARLEVIGVLAPDPAYGAGELMGGSADPALREVLRGDLEKVLDAALPASVDAKRVVLDGDPAGQLIERSSTLYILLVGSRGYGPLRAVLVGGVSGHVVRAAQCPVIVTPRGVEAPLQGLFNAIADP